MAFGFNDDRTKENFPAEVTPESLGLKINILEQETPSAVASNGTYTFTIPTPEGTDYNKIVVLSVEQQIVVPDEPEIYESIIASGPHPRYYLKTTTTSNGPFFRVAVKNDTNYARTIKMRVAYIITN